MLSPTSVHLNHTTPTSQYLLNLPSRAHTHCHLLARLLAICSRLQTALPASTLTPFQPILHPASRCKSIHITQGLPIAKRIKSILYFGFLCPATEGRSAPSRELAQSRWPGPGPGVAVSPGAGGGGRDPPWVPTFSHFSSLTSLPHSQGPRWVFPSEPPCALTWSQPLPFSGPSFPVNCRKGAPSLCPTSSAPQGLLV